VPPPTSQASGPSSPRHRPPNPSLAAARGGTRRRSATGRKTVDPSRRGGRSDRFIRSSRRARSAHLLRGALPPRLHLPPNILYQGESSMARPRPELHRRRWLDASGGGTVENTNRDGELSRTSEVDGRDVDRAVDAARRALDGWRFYPLPSAARSVSRRRDHAHSQGRPLTRDDSRMGQGARGIARRRPRGHRHDLLHRRRGQPPVGDVVPAGFQNKWR